MVYNLFLIFTYRVVENSFTMELIMGKTGQQVIAFGRYNDTGRLTGGARRSGLWGLFLVGLALTFLFNISWAFVGPAMLVLLGLYMLFIK